MRETFILREIHKNVRSCWIVDVLFLGGSFVVGDYLLSFDMRI